MSRFPKLLPEQERALFEIVKIFRKHSWEGRAVGVARVVGDDLLHFSRVDSIDRVDTDFTTLIVLGQAGYLVLIDWPQDRTITLKTLAFDYYDWCHNPPWHKPFTERWFSLAPDTRSAIIGGVSGSATAFMLGLIVVLIRGCLFR